jgi:hypothetical protein
LIPDLKHTGKWIAVNVSIVKLGGNPQFTTAQYAGNEPPAPADISKKHFIHTNFLRLYRKTPRTPQKGQVSKTLPPSQQTIFENCVAHQNGHVGKACVRMWTNQQFTPFGKINNALLTDHSVELQNWMHFIRALNHYLLHSWITPLELVTYRGSKMSMEDFDRLIS